MMKQIIIDGRPYEVEAKLRQTEPEDPARTHVLIPVFMLQPTGVDLVEACVNSLLHFSRLEIQVWVIDNNSPKQYADDLISRLDPDVNILLNRTEPRNSLHNPGFVYKLRKIRSGQTKAGHDQLLDGAYANGVGLEIGRAFIPDSAQTLFTIHSDTCVTHPSWLEVMRSKVNSQTPAVSGYHDKRRINALHVSCLFIDYQWLRQTDESFMPNIHQERHADRPIYDIGDGITWRLRKDGLNEAILNNTQNNPTLIENIPEHSPFKNIGSSARVFNDEGDIIFIHFGRGTVKAAGTYDKIKEFALEDWINLVNHQVLTHS